MEVCKACYSYFQTEKRTLKSNEHFSAVNKVKSRIFLSLPRYLVLILTLITCLCFKTVSSFNVDVKNAKVFSGPSGIYFGYSVAILRNNGGNW